MFSKLETLIIRFVKFDIILVLINDIVSVIVGNLILCDNGFIFLFIISVVLIGVLWMFRRK